MRRMQANDGSNATPAEMLSAREKLTRLAENRGEQCCGLPQIQAVRVTWPNPELRRDNKLEFFG